LIYFVNRVVLTVSKIVIDDFFRDCLELSLSVKLLLLGTCCVLISLGVFSLTIAVLGRLRPLMADVKDFRCLYSFKVGFRLWIVGLRVKLDG
jgi:hypothetical protein